MILDSIFSRGKRFSLHVVCLCAADKQPTTFNQQNTQYCFLDMYIILSHLIFLHVSIQKGSSSGDQTKAKDKVHPTTGHEGPEGE
jgi:hypothetical protein